MIASLKSATRKGITRGFTVLEMTMAIALSMGVAITLIFLLQQQVSFTGILARFAFLRDDAPQINTLMTTIINKADSYRIYANTANAKSSSSPVRNNAKALRLRWRDPDGDTDWGIIAFEQYNGADRLTFYFKDHHDSSWPNNPDWVISSKPSSVNFSNAAGILEITMTGPNGEEITYAGNPDY